MAWPLTKDASVDTRKAAIAAISSARPIRCRACSSVTEARGPSIPGKPKTLSVNGRFDEAGADGVGPDTAWAVVERDVLGEHHDTTLGGVVDAATRRTFQTLDAGQRHDRTPFAVDPGLFDHSGQGRFGDQKGAGEVDRDHPFPFGAIQQMDRASAGNPSGVHDTVEPVRHRGQHGRDCGLVGDVGGHEPEVGAKVRRGGQVGADDAAAFGQQSLGGGQADPRCGTGDDERA